MCFQARRRIGALSPAAARSLLDLGVCVGSQALMNSLFLVLELMLSIFLERLTKKESRNSSKPSSQTEKDDTSLSRPGSQGKGKI